MIRLCARPSLSLARPPIVVGWGAHVWIWMRCIYSSGVLFFISGVFQALSVKNKEYINLNIGEVWAQLHKYWQNDGASLERCPLVRTRTSLHGTSHLCPWQCRGYVPEVSAGLGFYSTHTSYISSMLLSSFLALWRIDSSSTFQHSLIFPSLGDSSQ